MTIKVELEMIIFSTFLPIELPQLLSVLRPFHDPNAPFLNWHRRAVIRPLSSARPNGPLPYGSDLNLDFSSRRGNPNEPVQPIRDRPLNPRVWVRDNN